MYGSQYFRDSEERLLMHPVEEPEHLDARRAAVGLEPPAENEARIHAMYDQDWPRAFARLGVQYVITSAESASDQSLTSENEDCRGPFPHQLEALPR